MSEKKINKKKIAIIVAAEESMSVYRAYFMDYPNFYFIQYPSVVSLRDNTSKDDRFCGFIIDLRTMMKTEHHEREFLYEVIESFPALRISHSADKTVVKGSIQGKNLHDKELFEYFLNNLCQEFQPRGIRTMRRKNLFLNVTLKSSEEQMVEPTPKSNGEIKANTMDISEEGGFILGTVNVQAGDKLNLVISELSDQTPIQCTVRWVQPWGESTRHLPGFGASFNGLTKQQKDQLELLLKGR